ncbi:Alpha/Beta hydrolase protein [Phellopilus nigrolimitatus]|nr:Alpha/Beta hydrolase protein [Phellopilus nigrolimitatus]
MRGHGRSGKPDSIEGYASNLYADDFAEVLKAFGLRKPVFIGWSLGGTIAADVATHLPADTLAGVVYLAGLPYTGPMVYQIGTPEIVSLLPRLSREESVSSFVEAGLEFIDTLFINPTQIEWETKCQWLGMVASQKPKYREFSVSRTQDPAGLFKLAEQGFPLLVLGGAHDKQVRSESVAQQMKPYFKNMELYLIEKGGSHAIFYENPEEIMAKIIEFMDRVGAK